MTFNDYQEQALKTATYPNSGNNPVYPTLGLTGEAGEVADKVKKVFRDNDGKFTPENKASIAKEVGDCLWYIATLANELGYTLDEIAAMNVSKIKNRVATNTIHGSGDDREVDQRYASAKKRLESMTTEELNRILANLNITCWDTYNFEEETKSFCPIAIAMNLHNILPNPSDSLVKEKMAERFQPTNIFKGVPGKFYTDNRKEDTIRMVVRILTERNAIAIINSTEKGHFKMTEEETVQHFLNKN